MVIFTKPAQMVFASTDENGEPRTISEQEAAVWGTEIERALPALMIYDTIVGMATVVVPPGLHTININGRTEAGDGEDGMFVDTDNGSDDTFESADGRTWYRADSKINRALQGVDASQFGLSVSNTGAANGLILMKIEALPGDEPIYVPPGDYPTNKGFYDLLNKKYLGPGRLILDGHAQAPQRVFITEPQDPPSLNRNEMFDGLKKQHIAAYTFVGAGANPELPDTYRTFIEWALAVFIHDLAGSGFNVDPSDHQEGRSGAAAMHIFQYQGGGGDAIGLQHYGEVYSNRPGATHVFASPAVAAMNGGVGASGDADGAYLQIMEFIVNDASYAVGSGAIVLNLFRTNAGTDISQFWNGFRMQNGGSVPIDIGMVGSGLYTAFLSSLGMELDEDGAFAALERGAKIRFDVTGAPDSIGAKTKITDMGDLSLGADEDTGILELNNRNITTQPTWTTLSGQNSWTAGAPAGFRAGRCRLHLGKVDLSGIMSGGTNFTVVATLPAGSRPSHKIPFNTQPPLRRHGRRDLA